jgi:hypothetical protein
METTLTILKPDSVAAGNAGNCRRDEGEKQQCIGLNLETEVDQVLPVQCQQSDQ